MAYSKEKGKMNKNWMGRRCRKILFVYPAPRELCSRGYLIWWSSAPHFFIMQRRAIFSSYYAPLK
jgi:hypothetical protein